jgi:murein DD-endopeptidase MepM/ murein hydrolase activator NlpD
MMGAAPSASAAPAASATVQSPQAQAADAALGNDSVAAASVPHAWPLPIAGTLLPSASSGAAHGIDVGVPPRTPIRASGAGVVVDVRDDSTLGTLVRIAHRNGYESLYANTTDVRVRKGERVPAGAIIAVTGDSAGVLPPHLHFEILRRGVDIDPSSLMTKGPDHGDLQ